MKKSLLVVLLILFPLASHASGGFAALSYSFSAVEPSQSSRSAKVNALQFSFGSWLNAQRTLGAEVRAGLGINKDRIRLRDNSRIDIEIDRYYGGYVRAQFPDTLPIRPYGLLGLTRVETTERSDEGDRSRSYGDISLGLGAEATIDHNVFVTVEYLRAVDRNTREISNITLGIGGRF